MVHDPHLDPALAPAAILAGLPAGVRRLVAMVADLYGGSWDACSEDIRRRRAGRPYLYRIDIPGVDELVWLHRLKTYEAARGEPLAIGPIPAENRL